MLAKNADPIVSQPAVAKEPPTGIAAYEWAGIPVDVFRHFNAPMEATPIKDIEMLKDITAWAKSKTSDEPSIGNVLQQISKIQRQLGSPAINEKSYAKVHQFIKMQRVIDEATRRQESLRSSPWI